MFDFLLKYWPLFVFGGGVSMALLRLFWRVSAVEKRVKHLDEGGSKDMEEVKAALKENMKISTQTNLSVEKLVSYLEGKGVIPSNGERRSC